MFSKRTRWMFPMFLLMGTILSTPAAWAQSESRTLAIIDGTALTEAEVRAVAADEFDAIDAERLQFEASTRQREHEALRQALDGIIADRLIQAEAERRGVTAGVLLTTEVERNVAEPTQPEMDSIYQLNQQRLAGVSREVAMAQVRQFLLERNYEIALETFVMNLRAERGVEARLGPYRVEVETGGHPYRGPEDAPVTLVEFSDFECPFCRRAQPVLDQIDENYGGLIRVVYRQFPLNDIHPRAQKAAEASLCAGDQDAFWPMHDAMFAEPIELEVASLKFKAVNLGLDTDAFGACLDSGKYADRVASDIRAGMAAGVTGTPTIYINGRPVSGIQEYATYTAIIDDELARVSDTGQ